VHSAPLEDDVIEVDGLLVTGLARTAVDVALSGDFAQALTAFDMALARGVAREDLVARLSGRRRRGIAVARAALTRADGRSASPGESWSRAQMIEARLPVPELQSHYRLLDGSSAYTDFDWDGVLVGEFDGLLKYGREMRPGETERVAVIREKLREDRLHDLGLLVIRWIWRELEQRLFIPRLTHRLAGLGLMP